MLNFGTRAQFWVGFVLGILSISVAIETVIKVSERGATGAFFSTLEWIGTFQWLQDYQTLITGVGAVCAAWLSVRAIRDQIKSSEDAANKQIKHSADMEATRVDAKRAAARAVLPLALSTLTEYSTETSEKLVNVLQQCNEGRFPKTAILPSFVEFPEEIISSIKEMIEYAAPDDRNYFWQTLLRVQVLRARLKGLTDAHLKPHSNITKNNIQAYILDSVEITTRAGALFDFGRGAKDRPPGFVTRDQMQSALRFVVIDEAEIYEIVEKYDLKGDRRWGEKWLAS